MNFLRFSGVSTLETCSADTVVPRITKRSTPAATTVSYSSCVRCGVRAPATVTPPARISASRSRTSSGLIGSAYSSCMRRVACASSSDGDLGEERLGVVVARPEAFEVEHAESAELAEHDRRRAG